MRVSAKTVFVAVSACVLMSFFIAGAAFAASVSPESSGRYEHLFDAKSFKIGQDALKYEMPEGNMFKIMPRLLDSAVFTRFDLPEAAQSYKEWVVTATVYTSESPAAGVGLWNGDKGHIFYVYPDGGGRLEYLEGTKAVWNAQVKLKNFTYPAKLSIERDPGGNILARVNGIIVATRLFDVDLKKPKLTGITSVSFVTHSTTKRAGAGAWFESLGVLAWGEGDPLDNLKSE